MWGHGGCRKWNCWKPRYIIVQKKKKKSWELLPYCLSYYTHIRRIPVSSETELVGLVSLYPPGRAPLSQKQAFPMVLLVIDAKGDWVKSLRPSALIEPVKCASSLRDDSSNLAVHLVFQHLCTTYQVPGKQPRTKHQSVSIYLTK